jgi:hypothetical protein
MKNLREAKGIISLCVVHKLLGNHPVRFITIQQNLRYIIGNLFDLAKAFSQTQTKILLNIIHYYLPLHLH